MSTLVVALLVLLVLWAHERNRCPECGGQLLWCDPARNDVPLTRCFNCEGDHPAYVRPEFHHRYNFDMTQCAVAPERGGRVSRLQFIWWWHEWRDWRPWFTFKRPVGVIKFIYRWSLSFGPLEIRRWERRTVDQIRSEEKKP